MTDLNKPVKRKMKARTLQHDLVILIEPGGILNLKEKGGRTWYSVELEALYKKLVVQDIISKRRNKQCQSKKTQRK